MPPSPPTAPDAFDELAAMFLTSPSDMPRSPVAGRNSDSPPHFTAAVQPTIELLWVGHLPVRGNLWLTPYADAVARQHGPTALLRIDGQEPSIQLLRAPEPLTTCAMGADLQQVVQTIGEQIDHWIIRAPSSASPLDLLQSGVDHITILTSADEAAVVATYQFIKQLAHSADEANRALPTVGLAVVGAEVAAAQSLVERLNRTTLSFLGYQIRLVMCLPRMDAGVKSTRYVSFAGQANPELAAVLPWLEQARSAAIAHPRHRTVAGRLYADRNGDGARQVERMLRSAAPIPPVSVAPTSTTSPAGAVASPQPLDVAAPAGNPAAFAPGARRHAPLPTSPASDSPKRHNATGSVALPDDSSRRPPIKLAPKPAMQIEAKAPAMQVEPDRDGQPAPLASYVDGLRLLAIRPPGHERIELAVDETGGLHLLAREYSLRELPVVQQWAMAHREILAMASHQHPINTLADVQCHLFTDRPMTLADLHGTDFHLHVLAPVIVDGRTGWYAARLSR